jgi:hypothetical protein
MGFIAEQHAEMHGHYVITVNGRIREAKKFPLSELCRRVELMLTARESDWDLLTYISVVDAKEECWLTDEECAKAASIYSQRDRGLSQKQVGYLRVFWAKALGGYDYEQFDAEVVGE